MGRPRVDFRVPPEGRSWAMLKSDAQSFKEKHLNRAGGFGFPRAAEAALTGRFLTYPWEFVRRQRNIKSMVKQSELIKHGVLDPRLPKNALVNSVDPRLTREQMAHLKKEEGGGRLTPDLQFQALIDITTRTEHPNSELKQHDLKTLQANGYPYKELIKKEDLEQLTQLLASEGYASGIGSLLGHKKKLLNEIIALENQMAREMVKLGGVSKETRKKEARFFLESQKVARLAKQHEGIINMIEAEAIAKNKYLKNPETQSKRFTGPTKTNIPGPENRDRATTKS